MLEAAIEISMHGVNKRKNDAFQSIKPESVDTLIKKGEFNGKEEISETSQISIETKKHHMICSVEPCLSNSTAVSGCITHIIKVASNSLIASDRCEKLVGTTDPNFGAALYKQNERLHFTLIATADLIRNFPSNEVS